MAESYGCITVDPPWKYRDRSIHRGGAERHYSTMTAEDLAALPVSSIAAPTAHLWLWVTNPMLQEGLDLVSHWGFKYKSMLTWAKPRFGMGSYLRAATEHLLLGVRGPGAVFKFKSQPSWFFAPVQAHSHKPEEFFCIAERCSPGPYIDLFARSERANWRCIGDELGSTVEQFFSAYAQEA